VDEATDLWLVRHAVSSLSGTGRWQGWLDVPLSDRGVAQARGLKEKSILPEVRTVISSSLIRCLQTAEILYPNAHVRREERLRTRNLGRWTGRTAAEIADDGGRWFFPFALGAPPEGETLGELCARVSDALRDIAATGGGHQVVVTHGAVIGVVMAMAGMEPYIIPQCSYCVVSWSPDRILILDHPGIGVPPV